MPKDEKVDGPKVVAEILKRLPAKDQQRLIAAIAKEAPELALCVEENLFNFDEVIELTPASIQRLLSEIPANDLILALKVASPEIAGALYSNMTERRRKQIQSDLACLPPQKLSDVEEAQRRILAKIDELRAAGLIHRVERKDVYV